MKPLIPFLSAVFGLTLAAPISAQRPDGPPQFASPEVADDGMVTLRIHAPEAKEVKISGTDIPGIGGKPLTKSDDGIWEITHGPAPAGAFRYKFEVDGLAVTDPRNPAVSESTATTWSLVVVPGSDKLDLREVPHGAVAEVTYHSEVLGRTRRMHVYTPPGYESGEGTFPVFYLLHGSSDSDDSWSSVGRAGFILDNLIADGKARPMIVVMPHGHTGSPRGRGERGSQMAEFVEEFLKDIKPQVEARYRTINERASRAIAGLSMGGAQTLDIAFAQPDQFGSFGVFSSGVFGIGDENNRWVENHAEALDNAELKKGLDLVWFGCGKDDFLIETARDTVAMLKEHGFEVTYDETEGGHVWLKWRDYLHDYAGMLFKE